MEWLRYTIFHSVTHCVSELETHFRSPKMLNGDFSFSGVFPVTPNPFLENQRVDFASQRFVLDCMIDQGIGGLYILANYSEECLLSDPERDDLLTVCLNQVDKRVSLVATCRIFSTKISTERVKKAADLGAKMVIFTPLSHGVELRPEEMDILEYFELPSPASNFPIMLQDATLSGVNLRTEFLRKVVCEIERMSFMKMEVPNTAAK